MGRLRRFFAIASTTAAGSSAAVAAVVHSLLRDSDVGVVLTSIADVALVVVGTVLLTPLIEAQLLDRPVLRRLILGRQSVEGTWIDVLRRSDGEPFIGLSRLELTAGELQYNGENFAADGTHEGVFATRALRCQWPELEFTYTVIAPGEDETGLGRLHFVERDGGPPVRYWGDCVDAALGNRSTIEGFRVTDPDDLAALDDYETQRQRLLELAAPLLEAERPRART